jgi:hypothetical protein
MKGQLPEELEVACLRPSSSEYRTTDVSQAQKYAFLNGFARKLREDKDHPISADVLGSDIVVLPKDENELTMISRKGLEKHGLLPSNTSVLKIPVDSDIYNRLLLRSIETSLREKRYIVREDYAVRYLNLTTSYAYMYSSGLSTNNKYFEVFRGCAFRLMVYSKIRSASLFVDPTFKFIPRATFLEISTHKETTQHLGGLEDRDKIDFGAGIKVVDVCPIRPEDCSSRKSPYQIDCLLYNERIGSSPSWPRNCSLTAILKKNVSLYPKIRESLRKCKMINDHVKDDSRVGEVHFDGSGKPYDYPLDRLRPMFQIDRIPLFVWALDGTEQDVEEMNNFFGKETKLPPDERRWYSLLFVRDLAEFHFGRQLLDFERELTQGIVRSWKGK